MPIKVDKGTIKTVIAGQKDATFTTDDIAYQSQVSPSTAYLTIKEMIGMGAVKVDHKDGRRIYYALSDCKIDMPKTNSIMSIPPAERFRYIAGLTDMVIQGASPSLLITGVAGIGKTYMVRERFRKLGKKEGHDFHFVTGHSSPMGLYKYLHDHREATIVFDDCDSVFKDDIAVNILKSALDSYDVRKVNWQSARMPEGVESEFNFEGSVIFISNLDEARIDEAVKSRTYVIDLQMSRKEIVEYMASILDHICPEICHTDKFEVLQYLDEVRDHFKQFNLRTLIKVARIKASIGQTMDWKKMALLLD